MSHGRGAGTWRPTVLLARLLLSVVVVIGVAVPVGSYVYARRLVLLGAQVSVGRSHLSNEQLAAYRDYARSGPSGFVVLGYNDLTTRPSAKSRTTASRTVGAASFDEQLALLQAAGFTSVSPAALTAHLTDNAPLPRHSVLITFDGGRERDWTVGDELLARYGFSAVVFVDPAQVTGRGSGFLSWTQLAAMTSSGRWSVGLDFSAASATVALGAGTATGPALLTHSWLTATGAAESSAQFQDRIRAGLRSEIDTLAAHGIGGPALVRYPFGPGYPLSRSAGTFRELAEAVNSTVAAGVLTIAPDTPVTEFYRAERLLPTMPIYSTTTTDDLFARIQAATS